MIVSYTMAEQDSSYKVKHLKGCAVRATTAVSGATFFDAVQQTETSSRVTGIGYLENGTVHPNDLGPLMSAVLEVANLADLQVGQLFPTNPSEQA